MKDIKLLGLLCLCLLSCGGKAQKNHVAADSVKQEQMVSLSLGASGFPECIKKAWRVSLQDSMVYVIIINFSETDKLLKLQYKYTPCLIHRYKNGRWKDVTAFMMPPDTRYKPKEQAPKNKSENELEGDDLVDWSQVLLPGERNRFSISLYNGKTDSIEKGRYRLTFYIDGKPCYIVFEL